MSADDRIPDWQLERFVLDELPEQETRAVREAIARDAVLAERIAALQRSNAEILERHAPRPMTAAIEQRLAAEPRRSAGRPGLLRVVALAACVAAAAAIATRVPMNRPPQDEHDITRVKGGVSSRLLVYRKAAQAPAEPLSPGSVAHPSDVVQLAYQVGGERYGVIVSIDGRGNVTPHLPKSGAQAAPLRAGSPVPLPEAYELDDAPAFERFYLVTAPQPFPLETVVAAARREVAAAGPESINSSLPLPGAFEQLSFVLRKEVAR